MSEYPERPPFFAMKFIRLLTKTAAALEIGVDGFALLTVIVSQEDACRYTRPVNFWNSQLTVLLGRPMHEESAMRRARSRCIKAKWLYYKAGSKSKPAHYYVTIPAHASSLSDGYCGESENNNDTMTTPSRHLEDTMPARMRQECDKNPTTSSPVSYTLNPTPSLSEGASKKLSRAIREEHLDILQYVSINELAQALRKYGQEAILGVVAKAKHHEIRFVAKEWQEALNGRHSAYGGWDFWYPLTVLIPTNERTNP